MQQFHALRALLDQHNTAQGSTPEWRGTCRQHSIAVLVTDPGQLDTLCAVAWRSAPDQCDAADYYASARSSKDHRRQSKRIPASLRPGCGSGRRTVPRSRAVLLKGNQVPSVRFSGLRWVCRGIKSKTSNLAQWRGYDTSFSGRRFS